VLGFSEASSMMRDGIGSQLQGMRDEEMEAQAPTARDELWMHNDMVRGGNAAPTASRGFDMATNDLHGAQAPSAGIRGEGRKLKDEIAASPVDQIAAVPVASRFIEAQAPVAKSMAAAPVNMGTEMMVNAQSPLAMARQSQAPVASFGLSQEMIRSRQAAPVSSVSPMIIEPAEPPTSSLAPTSSFMKMTEPAQAPTTSFKDAQAPTASIRTAQVPSASLNAAQAPTSSMRTAQAPSTSFNAAQAPTSSLRMAEAPTAELIAAQASLLRAAQAPSASLTTAQAPTLTQATSASFHTAQAPSSSLTQAPSASFNAAQSLRTAQAPSASFDTAQAPTLSMRTAQAPSASFNAAQAPTASFRQRASRKEMAHSILGRRLQGPADVCLAPPTCDPNGAYVECTKGGRISCQCSWVARCQPNVSDCYLHTNDKIATSCGF
jgi:hypothetical protein